jgi:hypothetical protein
MPLHVKIGVKESDGHQRKHHSSDASGQPDPAS